MIRIAIILSVGIYTSAALGLEILAARALNTKGLLSFKVLPKDCNSLEGRLVPAKTQKDAEHKWYDLQFTPKKQLKCAPDFKPEPTWVVVKMDSERMFKAFSKISHDGYVVDYDNTPSRNSMVEDLKVYNPQYVPAEIREKVDRERGATGTK